jgi:hypothetical protein
MTVHAFDSKWQAKLGEKELGSVKAISCVQFSGESAGLAAINLELRKLAWTGTQDPYPEADKAAPADPSLADIEKATMAKQPDDLSKWENECVEEHRTRMSVITNDHNVISISVDSMVFLGGAHGVDGSGFHNFDALTGQKIVLTDLVKPGFEKRWAELGAAILRRQAGLKPDAKLTDCDLFEDSLALNDNFFITPGGIGFSYNPYEIAAFARGIVEFTLPWKDIRDDLKPGTQATALAELAAE